MESTGVDNFYLMLSGETKNAIWLDLAENNFEPGNLFRRLVPDGITAEFVKARGTKFFDILSTGMAYLNIASHKFWNLVKENDLTGILPIDVRVKGIDNFDYKLCSIVGRCGPKINSLSVKVDKPFPLDPSRMYKAWIGLYFDLNTWDGNDFFSPDGTNYTIVSKKAADLMIRNDISNLTLIPLTQVENYDLG